MYNLEKYIQQSMILKKKKKPMMHLSKQTPFHLIVTRSKYIKTVPAMALRMLGSHIHQGKDQSNQVMVL